MTRAKIFHRQSTPTSPCIYRGGCRGGMRFPSQTEQAGEPECAFGAGKNSLVYGRGGPECPTGDETSTRIFDGNFACRAISKNPGIDLFVLGSSKSRNQGRGTV